MCLKYSYLILFYRIYGIQDYSFLLLDLDQWIFYSAPFPSLLIVRRQWNSGRAHYVDVCRVSTRDNVITLFHKESCVEIIRHICDPEALGDG